MFENGDCPYADGPGRPLLAPPRNEDEFEYMTILRSEILFTSEGD